MANIDPNDVIIAMIILNSNYRRTLFVEQIFKL